MATHRVLRSVVLAAGVLLIGACASQPASTPLLEKKFEREANNYQQFQHEGQTVYCQRAGTRSMPMHCVSETQLRAQVENYQRARSTNSGATMRPGADQTGILGGAGTSNSGT